MLIIRYRTISFSIMLLGIFLRVQQYLFNRNLWVDECYFLYSILDKDYIQNLRFQKFNQFSPYGFVFIEKLFISIFGISEYAVRLFPLICGVASVILFYILLKHYFREEIIIYPLAMFCFCRELIYYSSEAKQYSSGVFFTIAVLIIGLKLSEKELSKKESNFYTLFLSLVFLFSNTASLILAGVSVNYIYNYIVLKEKQNLKTAIASCIGWVSVCSLYFIYNFIFHLKNTNLQKFWKQGFVEEKNGILEIIQKMFEYLNCIDLKLGIYFFVCGMISLLIRKKRVGLAVLFPFVLLVIFSYLKIYPASDRLILFISPIIFIFIGESLDFITSSKNIFYRRWGFLLILLFMLFSFEKSFADIPKTMERENITRTLEYINRNKQRNDIIFVHFFSQYQFKYYAKDYGFNDDFTPPEAPTHYYHIQNFFHTNRWYRKKGYNTLFISVASRYNTMNRRKIDYEIKQLRGHKRVWIVFSHDAVYYSAKMKRHFDRYGVMKEFIRMPGNDLGESHLYLYDFSLSEEPTKKKETKLKSFLERVKKLWQ